MWRREDYLGKEQSWYSEKEYEEVKNELDKVNKILYNISKFVEEEHDWVASIKIREELKKWKNLSAKNAE